MTTTQEAVPDTVRTTMTNVERSMRRFSRNDSQDIVQEAMARAVNSGVDCDAEPWIRTVARRIAIDKSRRAHEFASGGADDLDLIGSPQGHSPEDLAMSNAGMNLVGKAMQSMPSRYRDALLTYAEEQQADSVSKRFGISAAATWTLLSRARSRLRQELDRVGYAFGGIAVPLHHWAQEVSTACAAACVVVGATIGTVHGVTAKPVVPAKPAATTVSRVKLPSQPIVKVEAINAPALPAIKLPVKVASPAVRHQLVTEHATRVCRTITEAPVVTKVADATRTLLAPVTSKLPEPIQKVTCTTTP